MLTKYDGRAALLNGRAALLIGCNVSRKSFNSKEVVDRVEKSTILGIDYFIIPKIVQETAKLKIFLL